MSGQDTRMHPVVNSLILVMKSTFLEGEPQKDLHMAASVKRVLDAHIASGITPYSILQNFGEQDSPLRTAITKDLPITFAMLIEYCSLDNLRNHSMMENHTAADLLGLIKACSDVEKWQKPVAILGNDTWVNFLCSVSPEADTPEAMLFSRHRKGARGDLSPERDGSKVKEITLPPGNSPSSSLGI